MAAERDLRARFGAAAFERRDHALAELGVENALADAKAVPGLARNDRRRRIDATGADDRA